MNELGKGILANDIAVIEYLVKTDQIDRALNDIDAYLTKEELLELLGIEQKDIKQVNYSPKQPRDGSGKWSSGKGSYSDNKMNTEQFIDFADSQKEITGDDKVKYRVEDYQNIDAYLINRILKETKGKASTSLDFAKDGNGELPKGIDDTYVERIGGKLNKTKEVLDNSMQHKLEKDTYLYRGLSHVNDDWKVGSEINTYGYSSTSFDKELAAKHTSNAMKYRDDTSKEIVLKIRAPKGTKGLVPYKVTGSRPKEQEFLLPRNSKMTVVDIKQDSTPSGSIYEPDFEYTTLEVTYEQL